MKVYRPAMSQLDIDLLLGITPQVVQLPVPTGIEWRVVLNVRIINASASPAIAIWHPGEPDMTASFDAGAVVPNMGFGSANASLIMQQEVITDTNACVKMVARTTGTIVKATVRHWHQVECFPAWVSWEKAQIQPNGRIDAVCDLGGGVVLMATRPNMGGRIFRSTAYGAPSSFSLAADIGENVRTIAASPTTGRVLVRTDDGLWKSDDAGLSFSKLMSIDTGYGLIVLPSGTVLLGEVVAPHKVFRSTDNGQSFSDTGYRADRQIYRFCLTPDGVVFNTFADGVHKSTDDGQTWAKVSSVNSYASNLYAIEALPDGRILIGDDSGKVFRSGVNGEAPYEQLCQCDGSADDFSVAGPLLLYSTWTGQRSVYVSDNAGERMIALGAVPTEPGDWIDHMIPIEMPDGEIRVVGGTRLGYVVRAAPAP